MTVAAYRIGRPFDWREIPPGLTVFFLESRPNLLHLEGQDEAVASFVEGLGLEPVEIELTEKEIAAEESSRAARLRALAWIEAR